MVVPIEAYCPAPVAMAVRDPDDPSLVLAVCMTHGGAGVPLGAKVHVLKRARV
jgi:hypothetical protein